MSAPARLLALRLQGFKSFAERTTVEFGPGISAVVGPNGSGKSNLADALRWALGEQGRSLRIRKSEDVIFAGSERRAALGMADVTLVVDNADGLLPVEYEVLELGRRLYRSGENDYLLNRQRIRLRDLVDLLDAANLADNAFLFIGQGMVDQALSLRPEERRPLFEEVAGVRRHERRRRRAEEHLTEAEANLARVEDILGELRPQARRLAAQAQQQATRRDAGEDLAAAIVASAHWRWHEAAGRAAEAAVARELVRGEADAAMAALTAAEDRVAAIAGRLQERAVREADLREADEAARTRATELQLRLQRLESDVAALERDRARAERERETAEAELATSRREVAVPVPPRDEGAESALAEADRALAEALAELTTLRAASRAEDERRAAALRAQVAARAERDQARRRADEAARLAADGRAEADRHEASRRELEARATAAHEARAAAVDSETEAVRVAGEAREAAERAEAERSAVAQRGATTAEQVAALEARLAEAEARIAREADQGIGKAARRRGGRRVVEGLEVDPELRAAVEAALGGAVVAYLVEASSVLGLAEEQGSVLVRERLEPDGSPAGPPDRIRRAQTRAAAAGGGPLADAVRLDPTGAARALLERALWVPDLAAALAVQADLPPGWVVVPRDGRAVVGPVGVDLGVGEDRLGRRTELEALRMEAERAARSLERLRSEEREAALASDAARTAAADARREEAEAIASRRESEEVERLASRALEAATREAAWHAAQAARAEAAASRAEEALAALGPSSGTATADGGAAVDAGEGAPSTDDGASAEATWEARVIDLRARRDRLAAQVAEVEAHRRDAEARRVRSEAAGAMAQDRAARAAAQAEAARLERQALESDVDRVRSELATAEAATGRSRSELVEIRTADAEDRSQLAGVEREAAGARERLRLADERLRRADVDDLEARLALDAIRESVLVELAGLGEVGLRALGVPSEGAEASEPPSSAGSLTADDTGDGAPPDEDDAARLERRLEAVAGTWAVRPPPGDPPTAGRLGALRRRFHDLGAANPFAAEEYEEVRTRLEALEAQHGDLRTAIDGTRRLIVELDALITEQFQATFRALETAFDARFQRLFGGGFARLSLTDPADLSATGVEIVARPPGKKPQTLAMLSGGERALTAVALLFAMLEVRPVPFCVLDEVDAALDEANIGRFTESLVELADRTQFIVITHNRGTIESADALYGVTVGDDSVSRVISLRLDEARALADAEPRPDPT